MEFHVKNTEELWAALAHEGAKKIFVKSGIYEIEKTEILQLDPFKKYGKPSKIATYFGGKAGYLAAIKELEEELYKAG